MGDNDFPAVMANGDFLQGFMKKRGMISEQETGQPAQSLAYNSQQMLGGPEVTKVTATEGPLLAEMPRYVRGNFAPPGTIIKAPHLDSPFMDERIRRGFVPITPSLPRGGAGPQLPGFV